jgi:hypothetical protein
VLEPLPPSLPLPPPPVAPVTGAVPPIARSLARAQRRIGELRLQTLSFQMVAILLVLAWPLLALLGRFPALQPAVVVGVPLFWFGGILWFGPLWLRRHASSEEDVARRLTAHDSRLASSLVTAVQLERALESPDAQFSTALARAHIQAAAQEAAGIDLGEAFPRRPVYRAARWALAAFVLLGVEGLFGGHAMVLGLQALLGRHAQGDTAIAEHLAEPITYDIALTYQYPAYTGLPPKTVAGTTGEISAPAGTEVHLATRADRDVVGAALAMGEQLQPLTVLGKRDLTGTLLVHKPGSYRFRFLDAHGKTVAEGPPIPIAVEADAPPKVTLLSPAPEVEVDPRGEVTLRYDAIDDFGLQSLELVYRIGGAPEQRQNLKTDAAATKHLSGDYHWSMAGLALSAGDRVTYRVEARDTDTVNGPKAGKSRDQVLKTYSEAEHHRQALERVSHLWEAMIAQLAVNLDAPDRTAPASFKAADGTGAPATRWLTEATRTEVDDAAEKLVQIIGGAAVDLRKDRSSPKELSRALANIAATFGASTSALRDARSALERWSRPGVPDPSATRRLKLAAENQIAELERDTIYLEKLLDHRRIEDLLALSKDLAAKRRDLSALIERYQKAPDEKTKAAIQNEIARLKERIGELMQRMAELSRNISDEHMNQDALAQMHQTESMLSKLDKIQQLMNEGKVDEAMKELQKLGDQMDQMQKGLNQAKGGFDQRQDPELARQFGEVTDKLSQLSKDQRALEHESRALKSQGQKDLQKQLQDKGEDFSKALRQKVAAAKSKLDPLMSGPGLGRDSESAQQAQESIEQLDRALAGKDYDAAAEEAARALALAQGLEGDLKFEATRAKRFPALSGADAAGLEKSAEQARQTTTPLAEVKKELDQLFPRGAQALPPEQRQKLSQLEKKQQGLRQEQQQLQQQMEQLNQKAPIFSPKMKGQMQGAGQEMGSAQQSMGERDPNGAASHAGEAASKLEQVAQGMKDARKGSGGGGGGGLMLPAPDGEGDPDSQDGPPGREQREHEAVEIPGAPSQSGAEQYRKELMDAMKQGAPARYKDQVKKYYEEIVK